MAEFRSGWFKFSMSTEVEELVADILSELVERGGLPLAESVARINELWVGMDFTSSTTMVMHETAFYWSTNILDEEPIPDWWEGVDRSSWRRRPAPPIDSVFWTVVQTPPT